MSHPTRGAWIEITLHPIVTQYEESHPTRGAWIEIRWCRAAVPMPWSHPTRGAWIEIPPLRLVLRWRDKSHPTRGAWIEMVADAVGGRPQGCRTPHGVRGLKCFSTAIALYGDYGRTPHGVRGLKSTGLLPMIRYSAGRTPHGVRGLKYPVLPHCTRARWSHPTRGAWIEMARASSTASPACVAPHTGCVD